jgi:hypothetical protein
MNKQYAVTRSVNAPAQRVWDLLTDAPGYKRWNAAVVSIDGLIRAGSTIKLVSVANPGRTFALKVTAMTPPQRMVWSGGMPFGLFTGTRTYLIESDHAGCRFSMSEVYTGPLSGLIFKSIPDLTASFNQFADGLKDAAERAAT